MSHSSLGKTFLDYRSGLRNVSPQQPYAASTRGLSQQSLQSEDAISPPLAASQYADFPVPPPRSPRRLTPPGSSHTLSSTPSVYNDTPTQATSQSASTVTLPQRPPPSAPARQSRIVAIITSQSAPTGIQRHLQSILGTHKAEEVLLIGPNENVLKQIKMECYTVAGQLGQDVSVQLVPNHGPPNMETLLQTLKGTPGTALSGVLLALPSDSRLGPLDADQDILDLEEQDLEVAWQSAIQTIHSMAKQTIPSMPRYSNGDSVDSPILGSYSTAQKPFFVIDNGTPSQPLPSFIRSAQDNLLQDIARSRLASGVDVGYASEFLFPPDPKQVAQQAAIDIPRLQTNGYATSGAITPSTQESPTKLWNLWAMQNE